ncbi:Orf27 [Heliothis zea nudivirus]|uniref:Orf27 n=1 Tax=Heliothis zea nudivirus 1 TaxID=3116536 RepID=Q8JKT4_9VIRU|nr:Orf27 [Heliothis zea nudivirus]AAN04322.1 Orf27 [Heliothis zea nudivirus]
MFYNKPSYHLTIHPPILYQIQNPKSKHPQSKPSKVSSAQNILHRTNTPVSVQVLTDAARWFCKHTN